MSVAVVMLPAGSYLTDGRTLFRVERTIVHDELFVELEDCATLRLIFCSVAELDVQPVQPALPVERRPRRRWFRR